MVWFYSLLRLYNLTVSPRSDFHKSCAFPFHLHMCYTANIFTIHWIASFPNSIRILFRNILFAFIAVVTMRMEYLWKLCNAKINACVYYMQCMHHTYDTKSNFTIKHREEFFFWEKRRFQYLPRSYFKLHWHISISFYMIQFFFLQRTQRILEKRMKRERGKNHWRARNATIITSRKSLIELLLSQ